MVQMVRILREGIGPSPSPREAIAIIEGAHNHLRAECFADGFIGQWNLNGGSRSVFPPSAHSLNNHQNFPSRFSAQTTLKFDVEKRVFMKKQPT
jgi:hypothetical protein